MVDKLNAIRRLESSQVSALLDVPANELGNALIRVYLNTQSLETRELITEFMTEAGVVWLRKLLTRDTLPLASDEAKFTSMNDYMRLIDANYEVVAVEGY